MDNAFPVAICCFLLHEAKRIFDHQGIKGESQSLGVAEYEIDGLCRFSGAKYEISSHQRRQVEIRITVGPHPIRIHQRHVLRGDGADQQQKPCVDIWGCYIADDHIHPLLSSASIEGGVRVVDIDQIADILIGNLSWCDYRNEVRRYVALAAVLVRGRREHGERARLIEHVINLKSSGTVFNLVDNTVAIPVDLVGKSGGLVHC